MRRQVRTFRDVNQLLAQRGYYIHAMITKKGKPLVFLKNEHFDQEKNILFVSRDFYGLSDINEETTLIPCKAPGIEIVSNIMRRQNIGNAAIIGIYDIYQWKESNAKLEFDPITQSGKPTPIKILTPGEKVELVKDFFNSLEKFVEAKGFTGIVFCGATKEDQNITTGDFELNWKKWGRVWNQFGVPCILTVPLNYISVDRDNEEATNMASLAGFMNDHTAYVIHGKNYYTLDMEGVKTRLVKNIKQFDKFMQMLRETKLSSWDTETTGLSRTCEDILTIQVALDEKTAYIIPYKHKQTPFNQEELDYIAKTFKKYFEEEAKGSIHIYQNAKYDLNQFAHMCGWRYYSALVWDCMAAEFQLNENRKCLKSFGVSPFSLKFFTYNYGGSEIYEEGNVGKDDREDLNNRNLEDVAEYGGKDVVVPYQLYHFERAEAKRKGDEHFDNVVLHVIGDIIYDTTILEQNGEKVDKPYLISLLGKSSDFGGQMESLKKEIYDSKEVKIANDIVCEKLGYSSNGKAGLFGQKKWAFDIGKPEHKRILFCDVMGLEADKTAKGSDSIGKEFKEKYKSNELVAKFDRLEKMKKAESTFILGHFQRYEIDKDLRNDDRMRSNYQFTGVLTGRISASNPNLQQIPSRGEFCKIIKRQFIANPENFFLKADYSAHEVRNWGNVSGDEGIGNAFDIGKQIRKQLRLYFSQDYEILDKYEKFKKEVKWEVPKGSEEKALTYEEKKALVESLPTGTREEKRFHKLCDLMFDLENRGDVHKMNYEFFCGVPAALVTPLQRQSAKGLVFGTIYGRGAASIAAEIGVSPEEAEDLQHKMFDKFSNGSKWLTHCKENGLKTCEVHSPLGRIRHLDSYMNGSSNLIAATDRQGPNSCIQGASSDIGFAAGKIMQDLCWNWFWKRGINLGFKYCNVVHDSTETEVALAHYPIVMYLLEHAYTTLVHRKLKKLYDFDLSCGFEVEADIGPCMSHMETFKNFLNFQPIIESCIDWAKTGFPNWYVSEDNLRKCWKNFKILDDVRKEELKQSVGVKVDTLMLVNSKNILELGLEF